MGTTHNHDVPAGTAALGDTVAVMSATTSRGADLTLAQILVLFNSEKVTLTATLALTAASHAGRILLLGEVGGDALLTVTLPAATGSGSRYRFIVSVVNTSNYVIQVVGNDTMDGQIVSTQDAADTTVGWETAADSDTITLNGTTKGGAAIGDWIELVDIATDQWAVSGQTTSTGVEVTPFSAAVV